MNSKTVAIVVAGAALLAVAALVVSRPGKQGAASLPAGPMFPELASRADSIAAIVVESASGRATIKRAGSKWTLAEKNGYPAKADRVREVVAGLSQLRPLEPKTSRPDRYAEIGVNDPPPPPPPPGQSNDPTPDGTAPPPPGISPAAVRGARVTLQDQDGQPVLAVLVGTQRMGNPPTVFVRVAGQSQSWLAEGQVDIPTDLLGWIDAQVVNLPRERVRSATITPGRADGAPLVLTRVRSDDANFSIADLPPGKAPKNTWEVDQPATVFSWFNFEDVRPADEIADRAEGEPPTGYRVETFDGLVLDAVIFHLDGRRWVTIEASAVVPSPNGEQAHADPSHSGQGSTDTASTEARLFNERHAGWAYLVPEHKALPMVARLEGLVIDAPEPTGSGPAGPMDPSESVVGSSGSD